MDLPQETNSPTTMATDEAYVMVSSRRRLPSLSPSVVTFTGEDVVVVKEREEMVTYDTIAGGQ